MHHDENHYLKQVGAEIDKVNAGHPDEDSYRAGYFETRFRHVAEKADNERNDRLYMIGNPESFLSAWFGTRYPSPEDVLDFLVEMNKQLGKPVHLIEHLDHRAKIQMVDLSDVIGQLEDVICECKQLADHERALEQADRIQDELRDDSGALAQPGRKTDRPPGRLMQTHNVVGSGEGQ